MKKQSRFIKSIVATSKEVQTPMPWQRGAVRVANLAARKGQTARLKSA